MILAAPDWGMVVGLLGTKMKAEQSLTLSDSQDFQTTFWTSDVGLPRTGTGNVFMYALYSYGI
jgi:hypothetical protein